VFGSKCHQQHPSSCTTEDLAIHLPIFPISAPGSFGRREAHASHGWMNPAAKPRSRAIIGSRISGLAPWRRRERREPHGLHRKGRLRI